MASLRKVPGCKNWIACFSDSTGKQRQRSTHTPIRKQALKIAHEYEQVAKAKRRAGQVQNTISSIMKEVTGEGLPKASVKEYSLRFLENKAVRVSKNTLRKYENAIKSLLEFLCDKADEEINMIESSDILAWQTHELGRVRPSTAKLNNRLLREMFRTAITENYRNQDPFDGLNPIKVDASIREGFSVEQVRTVLKVSADSEWRSMIIFGVYTGLRLGDINRLMWRNIDLTEGVINFTPKKTGKKITIPIAPPLLAHITTMSGTSSTSKFVHSTSAEKKIPKLSAEFGELLIDAGIRDIPVKKEENVGRGSGHAAKRERFSLSFHSLRHTYVSLLKNAGAGESIAMALAGHESSAVSAQYTHIQDAAKRTALEKLPNLLDGITS